MRRKDGVILLLYGMLQKYQESKGRKEDGNIVKQMQYSIKKEGVANAGKRNESGINKSTHF